MTCKSRRNAAMSYCGSLSNPVKRAYARAYWLHIAYDAIPSPEDLYSEMDCSMKEREKIKANLIAIKGTNKEKR